MLLGVYYTPGKHSYNNHKFIKTVLTGCDVVGKCLPIGTIICSDMMWTSIVELSLLTPLTETWH